MRRVLTLIPLLLLVSACSNPPATDAGTTPEPGVTTLEPTNDGLVTDWHAGPAEMAANAWSGCEYDSVPASWSGPFVRVSELTLPVELAETPLAVFVEATSVSFEHAFVRLDPRDEQVLLPELPDTTLRLHLSRCSNDAAMLTSVDESEREYAVITSGGDNWDCHGDVELQASVPIGTPLLARIPASGGGGLIGELVTTAEEVDGGDYITFTVIRGVLSSANSIGAVGSTGGG